MFKYETCVRSGREAERVTTAFYRFLEIHSGPDTEQAGLHTEIDGDLERKSIFLWSEEALEEFVRCLAKTKMGQSSEARSFGVRRFDDLY